MTQHRGTKLEELILPSHQFPGIVDIKVTKHGDSLYFMLNIVRNRTIKIQSDSKYQSYSKYENNGDILHIKLPLHREKRRRYYSHLFVLKHQDLYICTHFIEFT